MTRFGLLFWSAFAAVAYLAFIPSYEPLPEMLSFSDVLNHFAAFAILYLLHLSAYPAVAVAKRLGFLLAYGVAIEAVQALLPTRSASLSDVLVDGAALLSAALLHRLYRRFSPRFRRV